VEAVPVCYNFSNSGREARVANSSGDTDYNTTRHNTGGQRTEARILLILGIALIANINVLSAGFVWDDAFLIFSNKAIQHWSTLPTIFTQPFLASYYRPVAVLSLALDYALWGRNPFGFHLTNLLLHGANSIFVFFLLQRVSRSLNVAFLAALLFASHPAHKGVVYISDRTGMLSAFFFLGALVLYMKYRSSESPFRAWAGYLASILCAALAFFSKEESLSLPVAIIVTDMFLFHEHVRKRPLHSCIVYVPFIVLAGVYLWTRQTILPSVPGIFHAFSVEPLRRLLTVPTLLFDYALLTVLPVNLDFNPRTPLVESVHQISAWAPAVIFVILLAFIPRLLKWSRTAAFGLLWFLIVFAPMSNIIPIFPDIADKELFTPIHFLYLPSIGILLCVGCALQYIVVRPAWVKTESSWRGGAILCAACIVMTFSLLSIGRNAVWKNGIRLFQHMIRMHPEKAGFYVNLGLAYLDAGRLEEAAREFARAVSLDPHLPQARNSLGVAYLEMGLTDKAIEQLKESTRLDPNNAGTYGNLAVAYFQKKDLSEALAAAERAVDLAPSNPEMRTNLGLIYKRTGKLAEAEEQFLRALEYNSRDVAAHRALADLYTDLKQTEKARYHQEELRRLGYGPGRANRQANHPIEDAH